MIGFRSTGSNWYLLLYGNSGFPTILGSLMADQEVPHPFVQKCKVSKKRCILTLCPTPTPSMVEDGGGKKVGRERRGRGRGNAFFPSPNPGPSWFPSLTDCFSPHPTSLGYPPPCFLMHVWICQLSSPTQGI